MTLPRWVDEMPNNPDPEPRVIWADRLASLVEAPGRPAHVSTMSTKASASSTVSQLRSRTLTIPRPEGKWFFSADGCDVYAVYHGGGDEGATD